MTPPPVGAGLGRSRSTALSSPTPAPSAQHLPSAPSLRPVTYASRACNACRKRRAKCNGGLPKCVACVTRKTECVYDLKSDGRRTRALRQDHDSLRDQTRDLSAIYELLKSVSEEEAIRALQLLKTAPDPSTALATIQGNLLATNSPSLGKAASAVLPPMSSIYEVELIARHSSSYPRLEPLTLENIDLDLLNCKPLFKFRNQKNAQSVPPSSIDPQSLMLGGTGLRELVDPRLRRLQISYWTNVSISNELAAEAISLFLQNEQPVLAFLDADLFVDDLVSGRLNFCSELLVNALLSYACQAYSAIMPYASHLSFACYYEALRNWQTARTQDSLPSVQALLLLSIACNSFGVDAVGLEFLQESSQMAQRLHLFDPIPPTLEDDAKIPGLQRCRAATAWGSFNYLTVMSFYFHERFHIHGPPSYPIPGDWQSSSSSMLPNNELPPYMGKTFPALCHFFIIVHDMVSLYYNHKPFTKIITLHDAYSIYQRLLNWADNLSPELLRSDKNPHHVLNLHIWYHTAILDTFRPFVQSPQHLNLAGFEFSRTRPGDIFIASIRQLQRLVYIYRSNSKTATTAIIWHPAMLYVANHVLKDTSNPESRFYFLLCIRGYQRLARSFRLAGSVAQSIVGMARSSNIITAAEAQLIRTELEAESDTQPSSYEVLSRFIVDLKLSLDDPGAATMQQLVQNFNKISVTSPPEESIPPTTTSSMPSPVPFQDALPLSESLPTSFPRPLPMPSPLEPTPEDPKHD
ncbi:hypothetical protein ASPZODRAFT_141377 [Penicilliopsis zonata CBS 506.65]|uniref:Zn(2)-C6 fungal-type domain-containing protein n=1 Tax=Penicilliopsis zonata CBS 506.65 TaxID=1073090 RepID=A0A1L9SL53_9EURO|nr:hypothetical protein ASPZODRAFT_141377 [Penicilliopsis zonata CBS 506.65]OJJ47807.1 hypothetical protein ASPZODRAFT_141377 [Penicilliopsis zonata CBS 506.65]